MESVGGGIVAEHVARSFGDAVADTADAVVAKWDELKKVEKPQRTSVLDGVPKGMPALALADKLLGKAAKVGVEVEPFALPDHRSSSAAGARRDRDGDPGNPGNPGDPEDALGDSLLAIVSAARAEGLDPERALRGAIRRLENRVRAAEA